MTIYSKSNPAKVLVKHSFREVRNKNNPHYGKTRDSIQLSFESVRRQFTAGTYDTDQVIRILDESLLQYAKKLVLENGDDWTYKPDPEKITLSELYTDLTTQVSRTRTLTAKNILEWCKEFASLATTAGKSQAYISTVEKLAAEKFARLAGKENRERLINLAKFINTLEFRDETNCAVNDKFAELFVEMLSEETLELSLDSLD